MKRVQQEIIQSVYMCQTGRTDRFTKLFLRYVDLDQLVRVVLCSACSGLLYIDLADSLSNEEEKSLK